MSQLKARCIDQVLTFENTPVITSGDVNYDSIMFDFCSRWDGFTKTAVFYRSEDEVYYQLLDEANTCNIPNEVLTEKGDIFIGVFGVSGDTTLTSQVLKYKITKGAITENLKPSDPTPDIYAQIISRYDAIIEELERQFQKLEDLQAEYTGAVGNADTLNGHKDTYFATAESVTNLENGTTKAGDANKLGGQKPDYYFPKSGGTIEGDLSVGTSTTQDGRVHTLINALRKVSMLISGAGLFRLYDYTNSKYIIESKLDGTNTFNGTSTDSQYVRIQNSNELNFKGLTGKRLIHFNYRNGDTNQADDVLIDQYNFGDKSGGTANSMILDLSEGSGPRKILHTGNMASHVLLLTGGTLTDVLRFAKVSNGNAYLQKNHTADTDNGFYVVDTSKDGKLARLEVSAKNQKASFTGDDRVAKELYHSGNSARVHIGTSAPSDTSALWIDTTA